MLKVAIVMGSDSDLPVVRPAAETLEKLGMRMGSMVYCEKR